MVPPKPVLECNCLVPVTGFGMNKFYHPVDCGESQQSNINGILSYLQNANPVER